MLPSETPDPVERTVAIDDDSGNRHSGIAVSRKALLTKRAEK